MSSRKCRIHVFVIGLEHMPDPTESYNPSDGDRSLRVLLVVVLAVTIVGQSVDLWFDGPESLLSGHAVYEIVLLVFLLTTSVVLWRGWWKSQRRLNQTRLMLSQHVAERDAWRASAETALAGLGRAMDERFEAWDLTPAEREVALLMLKGHSHKRIAYLTGRSERTVRQHAVSVYQKSRLNGRAELAAFFLEDLMLPSIAVRVTPDTP